MKQGQFSQEKIIAILHQAETGEQTIQAICREHGLTQTTFYRWRKLYGGMSVSEAAYRVLRDAGKALHAKDICHRLIEGGLRIKTKTPITSIATSLKRDRRFRKVAPNTFEAVEDKLQAV